MLIITFQTNDKKEIMMKEKLNTIGDIWNSQSAINNHKDNHLENETLYAIFNSLVEGVIVADKNGKFIFFNPAAQKILGIGSKDIASEEWTSVYGCYKT